MRILLLCLLNSCLLLLHQQALGQDARRAIRNMQRVSFAQPVMVWLRLDTPVPRAEYCLIMDRGLVAQLDTLTLRGLLHHPDIYFAKLYPSSVPGLPRRKYVMTTPETVGDVYPFGVARHPYQPLERPPHGRLYSQKEPAEAYRHCYVRQNASDFGHNGQLNTLPGVDSLRVVYSIRVRERWKRGQRAQK